MRTVVNADMNRREVDPSRVGPHKRKGYGCECRCEHQENRVLTWINERHVHKQGEQCREDRREGSWPSGVDVYKPVGL